MILIALGSNLPSQHGSPEETLEAAKHALTARGIVVEKSSQNWSSPPFPPSDQPWFSNAVVLVRTDLGVAELLGVLKELERDFGRAVTQRNAARVLDLDIVAYHDEIYESDELKVPHARMCERGFVLMPLQEVVPGWIHPVLGQSVEHLIEKLSSDQLIALPEKAVV